MSDMPKTIVPDATIFWSQEAGVQLPLGRVFSPFVEHSYIARVEFDDGQVVIVCCAPGAASENPPGSFLIAKVADQARAAKYTGHNLVIFYEDQPLFGRLR